MARVWDAALENALVRVLRRTSNWPNGSPTAAEALDLMRRGADGDHVRECEARDTCALSVAAVSKKITVLRKNGLPTLPAADHFGPAPHPDWPPKTEMQRGRFGWGFSSTEPPDFVTIRSGAGSGAVVRVHWEHAKPLIAHRLEDRWFLARGAVVQLPFSAEQAGLELVADVLSGACPPPPVRCYERAHRHYAKTMNFMQHAWADGAAVSEARPAAPPPRSDMLDILHFARSFRHLAASFERDLVDFLAGGLIANENLGAAFRDLVSYALTERSVMSAMEALAQPTIVAACAKAKAV